MNDVPNTRVTTTAKARPKLVIFDDRGKLLQALYEKFTGFGYDVTPVYVSDGTYDHVIGDGRFKRGPIKPPVAEDWREQDKQLEPEHNLDRAHAEAVKQAEYNGRKKLDVDMYEGMLALPPHARAIRTEEEARALLAEMKPDCVLSDYEMRRKGDKTATNRLMGDDVMRVAHETCPESVRVMHSSLYTFYDQAAFESNMELAGEVKDSFKEEYEDALIEAAERGYLIASKDTNPMGTQPHSAEYATMVDKYFRKALSDGTPPRIVMGESIQR